MQGSAKRGRVGLVGADGVGSEVGTGDHNAYAFFVTRCLALLGLSPFLSCLGNDARCQFSPGKGSFGYASHGSIVFDKDIGDRRLFIP